jgi:hypothetical protein
VRREAAGKQTMAFFSVFAQVINEESTMNVLSFLNLVAASSSKAADAVSLLDFTSNKKASHSNTAALNSSGRES